MTTADRVAAIRQIHKANNLPTATAPDLDLVFDELDAIAAENTALRDRHSRLLTEQATRERDTRVAAKASIWRDVDMALDQAAQQAVTKHAVYHWNLHTKIRALPARPTAAQISELRAALDPDRRSIYEAQDRAHNDMDLAVFAEIKRLREYVTTRGRALHAEHGPVPDASSACRCVGCELIRGMDDDQDQQ